MYAQDSIELLQKSGIDFRRLEHEGIDPDVFAENLITSGLVLFDNVKWVSFHSYVSIQVFDRLMVGAMTHGTDRGDAYAPNDSGYDFGYLLKLLTAAPLPPIESEFFEILHIWFPHVYDIKHIMRSVRNLKGGLQEIADSMGVSFGRAVVACR
jgi:CCR4-NOT transcription complex subunit 7/8